jgi:hypothetical protein
MGLVSKAVSGYEESGRWIGGGLFSAMRRRLSTIGGVVARFLLDTAFRKELRF